MKKLAICFYGQPRFIDNDVVYKRYIELINQYDADVYIHSWISNAENVMDASDWSKQNNFIEKLNSAEQIVSMYKPIKVLFEPPQKFSFNSNIKEAVNGKLYYSLNNESNLISHLTTLTKSIKLIETPEFYDFILATRLDAYFYNFPDINNLNTDHFYIDGQYRHFADGVMLFGNKYIKALYMTDSIEHLSTIVPIFTSEEYVKNNLNLNNCDNRIKHLDALRAGYVRSNNGLDLINK